MKGFIDRLSILENRNLGLVGRHLGMAVGWSPVGHLMCNRVANDELRWLGNLIMYIHDESTFARRAFNQCNYENNGRC